ncbi:MAG: hypothetical protein LBN25_04015, partial [Christensenellaceae bacterium]|nr:hypothetical protein [Christensenellaceae bacterium]
MKKGAIVPILSQKIFFGTQRSLDFKKTGCRLHKKSVDSDKKEAMKEIKVCVQNIKGLWIPGEVWANTGL